MTLNVTSRFVLIFSALWLAGCDEKDHYKRVAEVAENAADRQAEQNTEMAQLNREVAEGTRRMVQADAETRKEIIVVHQELQSERSVLNDGFDALEAERQQIAGQRRMESMLVPVAKAIGIALVAVVVVGFCWTLLFGLRSGDASDAELTELLIHDLVRDEPRLQFRSAEQVAIKDRHPHPNSDPPLLSQANDLADDTPDLGDTN